MSTASSTVTNTAGWSRPAASAPKSAPPSRRLQRESARHARTRPRRHAALRHAGLRPGVCEASPPPEPLPARRAPRCRRPRPAGAAALPAAGRRTMPGALAEALLDIFGTAPRALAARPDRLRTVPGLSEDAVAVLKAAEALGIAMAREDVPDAVRPTLKQLPQGHRLLPHPGRPPRDRRVPPAVRQPQKPVDRRRAAPARHGQPHAGLPPGNLHPRAGAAGHRAHRGTQSSGRLSRALEGGHRDDEPPARRAQDHRRDAARPCHRHPRPRALSFRDKGLL